MKGGRVVAFVNVEGQVSRVHGSGGGFSIKESWQTKDGERSRYWAVFPGENVQVQPGMRVKVSGALQTKVTDPKPDSQGVERHYVDHVVGQAKVEVVEQAGVGSAAGSWPAVSQGGFPGLEEEPF